MNRRHVIPLLSLLVALPGCYRVSMSGLSFTPQEGWMRQQSEGPARMAQYELSGEKGTEPATLTIFHFGPQGAGTVEANIDRWISQFEQPDGRESKQVAHLSSDNVNGMERHCVDVTGTFVAPEAPGSPKKRNDPGFRLIGCVVATGAGPYYIRFLGPAATVERRKPGYDSFMASLMPAPVAAEPAKAAEHP